MLKFHARTDVGRRRKHNEDSLLAVAEHGVFVVADGVGGRKAGELASAITVNTFQQYAPHLKKLADAFGRDPNKDTRNAILQALDDIANAASKRVYEAAAHSGRQGMTTTLVAGVVGGGAAFVVHVGDSRAYLIRDGKLRQITEDHSMVNELVRTGAMTREEAATSRYRNVITRAVGLYPQVRADTLHMELMQGDRLVLCSDGLTDMVSVADIQSLGQVPSVRGSVEQLVDAALAGGGRDNITVIMIEPEATLAADAVSARAAAMEKLFLFSELPFHARLRVGRIVSEIFVSPGEVLMRQGDHADRLYVMVQGEVSVQVDGKEVAVIRQGEHFGEMALIDQSPRSADIVAKGFGHLLCVEHDAFRTFCIMEPALGNQMLWKLLITLGQRLRSTNQRLVES
ncbi:MAG: Stp1/IreP family PP2C-type Ser/Thr phosphatase [Deltaproteobacteria bacterium]|nr:Stp1/IreP family PP2C-type Ser/Thr phosphatase [Deltaproteobacteria bacterium]